jgi:hypothetical protein
MAFHTIKTMTTISENRICAETISANVHYKTGFFDYEVEKLVDIKSELYYYKNSDNYIRGFIEYIKTHIIKKLPNLSLVQIYLAIIDESNILIRFMIKITTMLQDILKVNRKLTFKQSVFVYITYENNLVFSGIIDFAGIP